MYRHLLVPTDGSALSRQAVVHAIAWARRFGARITFFHAEHVAPVPFDGAGVIVNPQALHEAQQRLDAAAHDSLAEADALAYEAGLQADSVVTVTNKPWEGIIRCAERLGCDLIVMASHGRSGAAALLLGSETQKVLTHSRIPVLVHR
ncbi:sulfate transporter [Rubrivivax gelatinosus]|nr:sulfate transporter [Rubrivivax gelatinosus]